MQPPSGFRDFTPQESALRARAMAAIAEAYRLHGFQQIFTSAAENLSTLQGKGGGNDNEKLIFRIMRRGEDMSRGVNKALDKMAERSGTNKPNTETDLPPYLNKMADWLGLDDESKKELSKLLQDELPDLGLRFDLTLPLARYVSRFRNELPLPARLFQMGPVWRADRPQKGRFREFWQCDVDVLGTQGVGAEVEVLSAINLVFKSLAIDPGVFCLNDRRLLAALGKQFNFAGQEWSDILVSLDKLEKIGADAVAQELSAKFPERESRTFQTLLEKFQNHELAYWQSLDPVAGEALGQIIALLTSSGVPVRFSPSLIRGQDYYTGTIFELVHPALDGSLAGGGRYDGLLELFGGQAIPAFGGSIGFERLLLLLADQAQQNPQNTHSAAAQVFFALMESSLRPQIHSLAQELRNLGISTEVYPDSAKKLGQQLKYASERKLPWAVIIGQQEWDQGIAQVKNMVQGSQMELPLGQLVQHLRKAAAN